MILYTYIHSPNSQKVTIYLELLNIEYEVIHIDLLSNEQKSDWFLKLNPNGRIPVLQDGNVILFESTAILQYLSEVYDVGNRYSFRLKSGNDEYWNQINWLNLNASHTPIQSQFEFFKKLEKIVDFKQSGNYSIEENEINLHFYETKIKEIYQLYDDHLNSNRDWFIGTGLNIVDISIFPWILKGIDNSELIDINQYKNLQHWIEKMKMFEQVRRGLNIEKYRRTV